LVIFAALMVVLAVRLYIIIGIEGGKWAEEADTNQIRTVRTDAPRGEIYDRNGVLIAGNHPSYVVDFSRNGMSNEDTNTSAKALIDILNKHGEKMVDEFPILLSKKGNMSYSFDREIAAWLKENDMPTDYTAAQAFDELRSRNNIKESLSPAEAQEKLIDKGITPPISVSKMRYTQEIEKEAFLGLHRSKDIEINPKADAKTAYGQMRELYEIDEQFPDLDEKGVRELIVIRSALTSLGYLRWMPVKIASDLKDETVLALEEMSHDLPGVEVVTESARYYPEANTASHVVGYLGKISQDKLEEYEKNGYKATDLIGISGIEAYYEKNLRGSDGIKQLQINASGEPVRELSGATEAVQGSDIALTIDMRLQKIADESIRKALNGIRAGGIFTSEFGNYAFEEKSPNAQVGAAVVIDVKTGEPLAISSIPDFDPNLFANGISVEDWNALQGDNPRDPLNARPLYNVAAMTAVQPGSTFKPLVGIAAQAQGLNPYRSLWDDHEIKIGDQKYRCMGHHEYVDMFSALEKSCNYYFYDIGTGRDWASNGNSLGYKISIDKISGYAKKFGLGVETGAEIDETVAPAPTKESKLANQKALLEQYLLGQAESLFGAKIAKDNDDLEDRVKQISGWMEENPTVAEIQRRLVNLGVRSDVAFSTAQKCKFDYFNYAQWTTGDEFNIAIGQGENAFTPMQMARYLATIGNGGKLESMSLVKAIEGQGEVTRPTAKKTGVKKSYLDNVIEGMRRVETDGTLKKGMAGLSVSIAGKTGTAQRSGHINPPDEVAYMRQHLSGINPNLSWKNVEKEMNRLLKDYPKLYPNSNVAVRKAVINLSGKGFNEANLDTFKDTYADFASVMAMAPADDPEIAVVCLIVQGGPSGNATPVVRELIGQYFKLKEQDAQAKQRINFDTFFTEVKKERAISGSAVTVAAVTAASNG
jgi:penicillin-binding protein 2